MRLKIKKKLKAFLVRNFGYFLVSLLLYAFRDTIGEKLQGYLVEVMKKKKE